MKFDDLKVGDRVYLSVLGKNVTIRGFEKSFHDIGSILIDPGLFEKPFDNPITVQIGSETRHFDRVDVNRIEPPMPEDMTPLDVLFWEIDRMRDKKEDGIERLYHDTALIRLVERIDAVRKAHTK